MTPGSISIALGALHFFGIDPVALLATVLASFVVGYLAKPLKGQMDIWIAQLKGVKSETVQEAVVPLLEAIDAGLGALKSSNPDLQAVTALIASGALSAATDQTHAKAIAATLVKQLNSALVAKIKDMNSTSPELPPTT